LVTNFGSRHISWVDPARGVVAQVDVGAAPWGLVVAADGRAYVSTAEGIAVVDTVARRRVALVPYLADVGPPGSGEYRAGGMGIALSPDGGLVYVGVNLTGGDGRLEVLDTAQLRVVGSATVGIRPFDVAVSRDGRVVYSIDHDSFSVTIVDAATLATRTVTIAPVGRDAFAKMHYGVIGPDDRLVLPIMGRALVRLSPSGDFTSTPLSANTHQHGVALASDGLRLLIVGTGPAGQATGGANLTILDLATGTERSLPLSRPHEKVAVSPDGRTAYLTGGYSFANGGWDGITVIDLETGATREIAVPGLPLDVTVVRE
jgi:DNA-binding beta-propeller fold protein YncE